MSYFIELVVSGLAIGAIYGLVAMGFAEGLSSAVGQIDALLADEAG